MKTEDPKKNSDILYFYWENICSQGKSRAKGIQADLSAT